MSNDNKQQTLNNFLEKLTDKTFARQFEANPRQVLTEHGFNIPSDKPIKVVHVSNADEIPAASKDVVYFPIPTANFKLNDAALDNITGGNGSPKFCEEADKYTRLIIIMNGYGFSLPDLGKYEGEFELAEKYKKS